MCVCDSFVFWSRAIFLTKFLKRTPSCCLFSLCKKTFQFHLQTWHMATNDNTETIYSWPWTTFRSGEKRQKLGWNRKKQIKTKQKKGKQSEPSGGLRRGKGPNSPPQTPARLASLARFLSLFPHCRTCSLFHSTTQHVAVTLIPHKWFKAI